MASEDEKCVNTKRIVAVSEAINHLCLTLYGKLAEEKTNVFFSPLSLSSALAMVFCGAKNETAKEMRQVLGYEIAGIDNKEVQQCYQLLLSALDEVPDSYTLTSANVFFYQRDFVVKEDFRHLLKESFEALVLAVDFREESAEAVRQANEWVKDKTNGMIPKLLDSLDPTTLMVVLNAVYFKGFWKHPFKESATYMQNFYNRGLEDSVKQVEMMHVKKSFLFVEKEDFKAIQLPYKVEEIAMLILLPDSRQGLEKLEGKLSAKFLKELKSEMRERKVNVALPKFQLEYSKLMKEPFQSTGMNRVFRPGAHLEGISDSEDLFVSDIIHKAVLVVNEEGSEAAAATALMIVGCALTFDPEFIVDHPFLFLIHNSKTNLLLFIGKVEEL